MGELGEGEKWALHPSRTLDRLIGVAPDRSLTGPVVYAGFGTRSAAFFCGVLRPRSSPVAMTRKGKVAKKSSTTESKLCSFPSITIPHRSSRSPPLLQHQQKLKTHSIWALPREHHAVEIVYPIHFLPPVHDSDLWAIRLVRARKTFFIIIESLTGFPGSRGLPIMS